MEVFFKILNSPSTLVHFFALKPMIIMVIERKSCRIVLPATVTKQLCSFCWQGTRDCNFTIASYCAPERWAYRLPLPVNSPQIARLKRHGMIQEIWLIAFRIEEYGPFKNSYWARLQRKGKNKHQLSLHMVFILNEFWIGQASIDWNYNS